MIEIRKTLHVARPVADVFEYLTDPQRIPEYVSPILHLHRMTTPTVGQGTRLTVEAGFLGMTIKQRTECTHFEPPRRFETRSVGGRFYFEAGFTLFPAAAGTRVEAWGNATAPSLFSIAEPLLGFLIERSVDADLARVKVELEARN